MPWSFGILGRMGSTLGFPALGGMDFLPPILCLSPRHLLPCVPGGAAPLVPGTPSLQPEMCLPSIQHWLQGGSLQELQRGLRDLGHMKELLLERKTFSMLPRDSFCLFMFRYKSLQLFGMVGFSPRNWKTQPLWDRGRAKPLAFMSCCLAWTKDIEIRQCKRKVSVLPDYAQMQYRHGGGWEGAVKWRNHRYITHSVNLSTSLFNTLANQAGVVFPIFGFLANCTVRNILYWSRSNTKRERNRKVSKYWPQLLCLFQLCRFLKTRFYQNLKGPNCLSSSLGRLENESKESCRW